MEKNDPPKFVKLKRSALRYRKSQDDYYRDGGNWKVGYKYEDGIFFSHCPSMFHMHMEELVEITEQEWRDDNHPYAPEKIKD